MHCSLVCSLPGAELSHLGWGHRPEGSLCLKEGQRHEWSAQLSSGHTRNVDEVSDGRVSYSASGVPEPRASRDNQRARILRRKPDLYRVLKLGMQSY